MKTIDLNCDLGEGGKFDTELMPLISSCNIACGGHYGDNESVDKAVKLAKTYQVNIGAHPSYPDLDNFGRKSIHILNDELKKELHTQIDLIEKACKVNKVQLHHIKPHGALYNDMRKSPSLADLILEVVKERKMDLILFVPPMVKFSSEIPKSIQIWKEGFADRAYQKDFSLVPRSKTGAVIHNPELISKRVVSMINQKQVSAISGEKLKVEFDTICVHSDTPDALTILKKIRADLENNEIKLEV